MAKKETYPKDIFVSLNDLLKMEGLAKGFSFLAKKQKVKSTLGGKHASKLRGRGLDFVEVRHYVPGDDIRTIDWKVTARTQKTHTRVFSEEKEKPALVIVDQTKSMFFGSKKKMKSVIAAEIAAMVAFKIQKEGDRVGGVVFGDEGTDIVYPKRDRKNIFHFMERIVARNRELATSDAVDFSTNIEDVFAKVRNIVTHDFLIVIISDFQRYNEQVIKHISYLAQHNDVILTKVYDPFTKELPQVSLIATDGDKQVVVDGTNKKLRNKIKQVFDSDLLSFKDIMKKYRIPVVELNTVDPVDKQLKEIFKGPSA